MLITAGRTLDSSAWGNNNNNNNNNIIDHNITNLDM